MSHEHNPQSTAKVAGHPIHPMLIPFPITLFVATFVADLVFWRSGLAGWGDATVYLLAAGLVMAALAAIAGLTDFLGSRQIRHLNAAVQHLIGNVAVVLIELANLLLRLSGGRDAILPWGLVLSLVTVLTLLFTGWKGWEMVYRDHVGVSDEAAHLPHR
jgi:uncharacterized membrane protein